MNALRLEKGYRHWGHDIGEEDDPLQAGLGFAVTWEKPEGRWGGFIGRDALLRRRADGTPRRRLVQSAPETVRVEIGRAPVRNPVTNAHFVGLHVLEKTNSAYSLRLT